jgi:hypothetical protein
VRRTDPTTACRRTARLLPGACLLLLLASTAVAHPIGADSASFVQGLVGAAPGAFAYLGGRHMVTGYDHLLYLVGVVFFLRRARDLLLFVSLFTLGHSITLVLGVLLAWPVNPWVVDAVIGLSVAYKGFENLGGFVATLGAAPDPRLAVLGFGLIHGLGLSVRVRDLGLAEEGLIANLLAFNLGVEAGQLLALALVLALLGAWRRRDAFARDAFLANTLLMTAGFLLAGQQLAGYLLEARA